LKRGPRKQDDTAARLLVDTLAPSSPSGALDLSSSAKSGVNLSSVKREIPTEDKKFNQVTFASKGYVPLAPKAASLPQIPVRKIIVDNPSLPRISSPILPLFSPGVQVSPSKSTISLPSFNGTNTIILTPLGQPGLPSTIFSLPSSCSSSSSSPTTPSSSSSTLLSLASFTLPPTKQEETVVIKSEPDLTIVAMDDGEQVQVKQEATERDPTTTCCAANSNMGTCSQELIDLNSLTQMLDLVTMEPKIAGELTAAEKYIIKSRLRIEFWKAEETPSFICSAHRRSIVHSQGPQACSVCAKRKSKKFDMYFITYRMAVEFYMTAGKFLAIGRLACSNCKAKSLKGLDFSNSYLVPDYGHPLEQGKEDDDAIRKGMEEEEEEEKKRTEKREVILQPIPSTQGKLATIQPLPPRPQALPLLPPTLSLTPSPINTESSTQKIQKLHSALAAVNPGYRPPGFTITSLSECSEGVLQDAIRATQVAVSTLLSAIAPGQEASLWHHVKPSMDHCLLKEGTQQATHTPMNQ